MSRQASYNAAGNMTCLRPGSSTACAGSSPIGGQLTWDNEGRLAGWQNVPGSRPTSSAGELYGGSGQRVLEEAVQVQGSGSTRQTTTTTTAYLGALEEVTSSPCTGYLCPLNNPPPTTTTYYYAGGVRLALATNGAVFYPSADVLGSTEVTLAASGSEQGSLLSQPYGGARYSSGSLQTLQTLQTLRRYTGQVRDATLMLTYPNARYYDAGAGQFVSADNVLPGDGYDTWGLSRYAYVEGNPETRTDADGHCFPFCTVLAGAIIGGAAGLAVGIYAAASSGKPWTAGTVANIVSDVALGAGAGAVLGSGNASAAVGGAVAAFGVHATNNYGHGFSGQNADSAFRNVALSAGFGAVGGVLGDALDAAKFGGTATQILMQGELQGGVTAAQEATGELFDQAKDYVDKGTPITLDGKKIFAHSILGALGGVGGQYWNVISGGESLFGAWYSGVISGGTSVEFDDQWSRVQPNDSRDSSSGEVFYSSGSHRNLS